ncbi:MAG TPA: chemotaxis response regulator protein-glutamate methylesterase [Humisphaera sp.]|jgi:two-component system chemotaxis response regulator CheB|nr:chemotaxis response regulator protein-glutamate methylesterase [Humisphaera sp.]
MNNSVSLLIVDDSRLFRSALEEALRGQPGITVIGSVFNGAKAIEFIRNTPPDLVTLDVEMPGMDGLQTLEQIQAFNAGRPPAQMVGVIMVSSFTRRGEQVTIKALQAGAFDFIAKPSGESAQANLATLRDELLAKIRAFSASRRRAVGGSNFRPPPPARPPAFKRTRVRAVVIGASTGGPRALSEMLPALCQVVDLPILIVQHMPQGFTRSLAESLARQTGRQVVEASDGMALEKSTVYIAPGAKHMLLRGTAALPIVALNEQPPENGCRPSADVLFRSAAAVFGGEVIALILTGMGRDGTAGLGAIRRAGGHVVAQDEASSVVWGMPGSAVEAGVVDEVHTLRDIPAAVATVLKRLALK